MSQFESPYKSPGVSTGTKPDNYLIYAILTTLCCCIPFGIVSIVYAAQVDSKWNSGDHAGAIAASANAKKWALIALVSGLIVNVLVVILQVVAGIGAAGMNVNQGNF